MSSSPLKSLVSSGGFYRLSFDLSGRLVTYDVGRQEADRVALVLQTSPAAFVVFDTATHRVAVKIAAIDTLNVLFEPFRSPETEIPDAAQDHPVLAYFDNAPSVPSAFNVDPDSPVGEPGDEDHEPGPLDGIFMELELVEDPGFVSFLDSDGEAVFVNAAKLHCLEVPQIMLDSTLYATFAAQFESEV